MSSQHPPTKSSPIRALSDRRGRRLSTLAVRRLLAVRCLLQGRGRQLRFVLIAVIAFAMIAAIQIALLRAPIGMAGTVRLQQASITGFWLDGRFSTPRRGIGLHLCFKGAPPRDIESAITLVRASAVTHPDVVTKVPPLGVFGPPGRCIHLHLYPHGIELAVWFVRELVVGV
jgi:hypothetical protein